MMRYFKLTAYLIGLLGMKGFSQEPPLRHLYYCNENESIEKIIILDDQHFIGWSIGTKENFLVLYNQSRLPVDTFHLGRNDDFFLQALQPLNAKAFYFNTLNKAGICRIDSGRFSNCSVWQNRPDTPFLSVLKYANVNLYLGISGKKIQRKTDYFIEVNGQFIELTLNTRQMMLKDRPGKTAFEFYMDEKNNKIIVPVFWAGAVIFLDGTTGAFVTRPIPYPVDDKTIEGVHYFFDSETGKHYFAVQRTGSGTIDLFEVHETFNAGALVGRLDFLPEGIKNSRALKVSTNKNQGKAFVCHYLVPF